MIKEIKSYKTSWYWSIIDITNDVNDFLQKNNCQDWLVNVFTRHTTAVIKINESEEWLWKDLKNWTKSNIPADYPYHHNDLENRDPKTMCESKEECLNWHSHIASMLFGVSSETIPVYDWKMMFGRRQRILLIEMDHARTREIIFSFLVE